MKSEAKDKDGNKVVDVRYTTKNKKRIKEGKLELKMFNKKLRKHTLYKESKK